MDILFSDNSIDREDDEISWSKTDKMIRSRKLGVNNNDA
jgi:hypothetical protein